MQAVWETVRRGVNRDLRVGESINEELHELLAPQASSMMVRRLLILTRPHFVSEHELNDTYHRVLVVYVSGDCVSS